MPQLRFESRLESDQDACFIRVPPAVLTSLGQGKRVPVKVTINGYTSGPRSRSMAGSSTLG
jgi:hypothetical protein